MATMRNLMKIEFISLNQTQFRGHPLRTNRNIQKVDYIYPNPSP